MCNGKCKVKLREVQCRTVKHNVEDISTYRRRWSHERSDFWIEIARRPSAAERRCSRDSSRNARKKTCRDTCEGWPAVTRGRDGLP